MNHLMYKRRLVLIAIITVVVLLFAGCSAKSDPTTAATTTEKPATTTTADDSTTAATEDDSPDETMEKSKSVINGVEYETGENLPWPSDHLPDLPRLEANIVTTAYDQNTKVIVITYENVEINDIKKYTGELKEKGFSTILEAEMEGGYTFTGEHKNGQLVMVMHLDDQTGVLTFDPDQDD